MSADSLISPEKLTQRQQEEEKIFQENVVKPDLVDNTQLVVKEQGELGYIGQAKQESLDAVSFAAADDQAEEPVIVHEAPQDTHGMSKEVFE